MVKVVMGMMGSSVAGGSKNLATAEQTQDFLSMVNKHNVKELDTARVYADGKSEELLGEVNASSNFRIATKAPAFLPGSLEKAKIIANCNASLAALKMDKVDLYYLHGPDSQTPLEEQCDAIGQLYAEGKFARFGVSNISAAAVQTVHDYCKSKGYVLPTVYQGGYNPLLRSLGEDLFPLLKKLGMSFYAFSPLAGGLLAKGASAVRDPEKGTRYDEMKVFGSIYLGNEEALDALERIGEKAKAEGVSLAEATLRWFMHHSPLGEEDAVILGASSKAQAEATLAACEKGPLSKELLEGFNEMGVAAAKKKIPSFD